MKYIQNDIAVYPVIKNHKYTITNITYDKEGYTEYWIENYDKQLFDEWEFRLIFKLDINHKRKLKLQNIEKIKS